MKPARLIYCFVALLASLHLGFGQSRTKTWTQSRAVDFSANQFLNLSQVSAPEVGVQLSPPLTKTQSNQYDNSLLRFLAKDGAGNYVATTAIGGTVHAQRYSAAGIAVGGAISVNDAPALADGGSRAALFDDGTYIVVWRDANENMEGQVISPADQKVGAKFAFNDTANYSNNSPIAYANGGDQLFWIFYPLITPQGYRIHVQKRDKSGNKVGETFLLNTGNLTSFELDPAVASTAGGFSVAWPGANSNSSNDLDIYLREFNSSGTPITATLKVNDDVGANAQFEPVLCTDDSMNLLVAWGDQRNLGGMSLWIFGQLFNSKGMRIGTNVRMTDSLALAPVMPDLAYSSGQFRLSWSAWNASLRVYQTFWNAWKVAPVTWGVMFSSIFDAGPGGTLLKSISWTVDGTAYGTIQMRVRIGYVAETLQNLPWHGPSDTAGYYTNPAGEQIGSFANTGRYMQYAAYFNGINGQSPVLRAVSVVYASQDTIPPAKPGGLAAIAGHHAITLTWSANHETDLAGYRVYRGLASGTYAGGAMAIVPGGVTSFVDYFTLPDTVYHYAVSAFDSSYNESALSDDASTSSAGLAIYVTKGGSAGGDGTLMNPFPTISQGFAIALAGDTVVVLEGTFSELLTIRAGVSLVGSGPQYCTVSGPFDLHDGNLVKGFTLTSTVRCVDGRPTLSDNTFLLTAGLPANGLAIQILAASAPAIFRNSIVCPTEYGSGIQDMGAAPHVIRNNTIQANDVGIDLEWSTQTSIINNTIIASTLAALIDNSTSPITIVNNILISTGPYKVPGLSVSAQSPATILYNDILPALSGGAGNISLDPKFSDAVAQNYHLQSGSPAKDAGDPDPKYNDADGSRNDMGAYGGPDPYPEGPPVPLVRSIALTGVSGLPGDTVAISVRVDDPRGVLGGAFAIEFDPSLLTCARLAPGSVAIVVHDVVVSPGAVKFLFGAAQPFQTGQNNIATLFLVVSAKAAAGDASPVTFRTVSLLDVNHQPVILRSVTNGAVAVNQYVDGLHHIFVDAANSGTENGTRLHPWKSIMKAMAVAGSGDSILVAGGLYSEEVLMKDSVHVVGSGAAVTVLDAPPDQPAVYLENIHSGELSGFTLRAGANHQPAWPLIMCNGSSPYVRSNMFQTVSATVLGIHCYNGGTATILNNYFNGTQVLFAGSSPVFDSNVLGGMYGPSAGLTSTGSATPTISRNRIDGGMGIGIILNGGTAIVSNNWITCGAGLQPALSMMNLTSAIMRNNVFSDSTTHGTGITVSGSTGVDVINNTFITHLRGSVESNSSIRFLNNIVTGAADKALMGSAGTVSDDNDLWNNAANYSGVAPGADDFSKDPRFRNPSLGDYRLGAASPCINAGSPAAEFLNRDGTRNDVGAYGGPYADSTLFTGSSTVLSFDSVSAEVTDTIQIPLRGVNIAGVAGLTLKLSYDAAILKVLEAKAGGATKRFAVEMTNVAGGSEVISLNSGRGITDDRGDLLTLVCAVSSGHTGTTIIHSDSATACNESMSVHACTPPGDCRIAIGPLGVAGGPGSQLPAIFRLYQNYPNPFNPATTIVYEVPRMAQISLTIFDLLGRRVATLVNGIRTPGRYSVEWNAVRQSSGVYFCRMQAGNFAMTTKLLLVR